MTGRIPSQLKPKVEKVCACGKRFITSYSRKLFCTRDCNNEFNHNSPSWNPKQRDWKYKRMYGITIEDYNKLFSEQNGCCKICKKHQSEFVKKLNVDHNHKTGQIRGLLCHNCNLALGRFGDNPDILAAAKEYVS